MTSPFSIVDVMSLAVTVASLAVTVSIFHLGRRLSFRQQRDRVRELRTKAWEVLGPIRTQGLNNRIIVINVERYKRGYDGSNDITSRGYAYSGPELIEIVNGGVEVIIMGVESFYTADGRRTLASTEAPAPTVVATGHIPWAWIEDIVADGDEFDGSPIFFVRHDAAGHSPYDFVTYREGRPVAFGPNNRDYYPPIPELGTVRPRLFRDWIRFFKMWRLEKKMSARTSHLR